jgi:hypothetical protein
MGHVPTKAASDMRSRGQAHTLVANGSQDVLIAHGGATTGDSLFLRGGRLVHSTNAGGKRVTVKPDRSVPSRPSVHDA